MIFSFLAPADFADLGALPRGHPLDSGCGRDLLICMRSTLFRRITNEITLEAMPFCACTPNIALRLPLQHGMSQDPPARRRLEALRQRRTQHLAAHAALTKAKALLHVEQQATEEHISWTRADNAACFLDFDISRS